eukprot:SAG31_NODE_21886_length_538_cov_1.389522_1_plen_109_part_00
MTECAAFAVTRDRARGKEVGTITHLNLERCDNHSRAELRGMVAAQDMTHRSRNQGASIVCFAPQAIPSCVASSRSLSYDSTAEERQPSILHWRCAVTAATFLLLLTYA